jgi:hypothetical protein
MKNSGRYKMKNSAKVGLIVVLPALLVFFLSIAFAGNDAAAKNDTTNITKNMTNVKMNTTTLQNMTNVTYKDYVTFSNNTGKSIEDAIVIYNAKTDWEGVDSEYYYLEKMFGKKGIDWNLDRQSLRDVGKRYYDVMEITLSDGRKITIYFDITGFFGKL